MAVQPRILIIGAGALGLTSAYHLEMAGAKVSFLVRKHRVNDLSRPQGLYCFNYHNLKTFDAYDVIADSSELKGLSFDFVLLTLDGAVCRSDQGINTIKAIGSAFVNTATKLMINGVGLGLYEHVKQLTGFSDAQLMQGTMGMYAYQVGRRGAPAPSGVNQTLYEKADIAFLKFPNGADFVVSGRTKLASWQFMKLFNRCRVARCRLLPEIVLTVFSNSFFPFTTACEINGWQGTESLIADTELWHLCCQSKREIMGLDRHGVVGKLMSVVMSNSRQAEMIRRSDESAAAMGFTEFNRFHHGGKVLQQDIQIMENCLAAGEQEGKKMLATRELLQRRLSLPHGASQVQMDFDQARRYGVIE